MEIELKFKLNNTEEIKNKLNKIKAKFLGKAKEADIYFKSPSFSKNNKELIFRLRDYGKKGLLTLKYGGSDTKFFKQRNEIESFVDSAKSILYILKRLGFKESMRKEKIRETYRLDSCLLLVDKLPFLGYFLEIESSSQRKIKKIVNKLELDLKLASPLDYSTIFHNFYLNNIKKFENYKQKIELTFKSEKLFKGFCGLI
ncbi:MAG: class IV adenylate cyclase [Candidatus Omnitrophota bacterium]